MKRPIGWNRHEILHQPLTAQGIDTGCDGVAAGRSQCRQYLERGKGRGLRRQRHSDPLECGETHAQTGKATRAAQTQQEIDLEQLESGFLQRLIDHLEKSARGLPLLYRPLGDHLTTDRDCDTDNGRTGVDRQGGLDWLGHRRSLQV